MSNQEIIKMIEESKESLKEMLGEYKVSEESINGRNEIVFTKISGERFIAGLVLNQKNMCLVVIPEDELEDREPVPTQLEKSLLQVDGKRALHRLQRFGDSTGWELTDMLAIFSKKNGRVLLIFEDGELRITESELDLDEDESE